MQTAAPATKISRKNERQRETERDRQPTDREADTGRQTDKTGRGTRSETLFYRDERERIHKDKDLSTSRFYFLFLQICP